MLEPVGRDLLLAAASDTDSTDDPMVLELLRTAVAIEYARAGQVEASPLVPRPQEFAGFVSPVVRLYFATFLRVPDVGTPRGLPIDRSIISGRRRCRRPGHRRGGRETRLC